MSLGRTRRRLVEKNVLDAAAGFASLDARLDSIGGGGGSVAWADITGKPSTFTPSAHTHAAADVTDFAEAVDDRVAALLVAGSNVTLTYNDGANTLTVGAAGGSSEPDIYQYLNANRDGNNDTNDQSWFAAANDAATVEAATYRIRGLLLLTSGGTSHSIGLSFGGTATISGIVYIADNTSVALNTTTTTQSTTRVTQATNTTVTAANTTTNKYIMIEGLVTFSGAGTFIPQFRYSAASGSSSVRFGTFFEMRKLAAVRKGTWD